MDFDRLRGRILPWFTTLLILCACPGEASDEDATAGQEAGTMLPTSGGTGEAGTTGEVWDPVPARGIHIEWVEANQAVGVPIAADGGPVGPTERIAALLRNRRSLLRAFWSISDDWQPREIEARLHVRHPDGTTEVMSQTKMVEGVSFIGDLNRVFFWGIEADDMQPGLGYKIDLWETSPDFDDLPESNPPPHFPFDGGETYVGIENSYMVLKVVVVPFEYDDGQDCKTKPDTSEETMQLFEDLIYMQNPVDRVEYTLHDPVSWTTPLSSFVQLNQYLSNLRFEEGALPETYYYGLIDVCAPGLGGAGGQAYGIPTDPTSMEVAYQRVSSGLSLQPQWSAETFVHEVGHSQGRRHVHCNGMEAGSDPSYPHEGGVVGEWGFGVLDFALRHPTVYKDYMTYCNPTWVGTWGWNKVYPVIRALSMWDDGYSADGAPAPGDYGGSLLVGAILPSGAQLWHTVPGAIDSSELDEMHRIEFRTHGRVRIQPTRVTEMPDGHGELMIVTPLPPDFDCTTRLTRLTGTKRVPIDHGSIHLGHTTRQFSRPSRP
jgi:hypothetical protein